MKNRSAVASPDIAGEFKALRRAARRAFEIGLETGTPVWVMKDGKIVDLTKATGGRRKKRRSKGLSRPSIR